MKSYLRRIIARVAPHLLGDAEFQKMLASLARQHPDSMPEHPDYFQFPLRLPSDIERRLDQIPTQTSLSERRFLYQFFCCLWTGEHDVVEIGPFLGGTTRAIAMGMQANPRGQSEARLYTFDRFKSYFGKEELTKLLQPLLDNGLLHTNDLEAMGEDTAFMDVFRTIHGGNDYFACVEPSDFGVPDSPGQDGDWLTLAPDFKTDAVFIDGCKSWYGTKYFMQAISHAARPGAVILFQDYGWYTCFWLSAFVEQFADQLALIGHVDNTYAFSLRKPLFKDEIERQFADTPEQMGRDQLAGLMDRQVEKARARGDRFAVVRHTMHKAAAMAYIGESDRARTILSEAERLPDAGYHAHVIQSAWESPTYRPDGPVTLGRST
ncbi:MAG: putative O-methyltransferase YrrM [Candidatus Omnitrophota bacterium]|jgi:predicted O-methyltransferase YrrM